MEEHSITILEEKISLIRLHSRDDCKSYPDNKEKLLNLLWKCEKMRCHIATKYRDILAMQSQHSHLNISNPSDPEYYKLVTYANRIAAIRKACTECKRHIDLRLSHLINNGEEQE